MNLREEDLQRMIDNSEKKRHEISNGRIRAFYVHLSQDVGTAFDVGKRHDAVPIILEVSAFAYGPI